MIPRNQIPVQRPLRCIIMRPEHSGIACMTLFSTQSADRPQPPPSGQHQRVRALPPGGLIVCAALLLFASPAPAQHGMDFLLAESPRLPQPGGGYLYLQQDYLSMDRNLYRVEPGVLFGLSRRVAVSVPARMEKPQGRSARYAATAPAMHFRLTSPRQRLYAGLSARYAIAHQQNDRDRFTGILSAGHETRRLLAVANLIYDRQAGQRREWSYAAAARINIARRHAAGVEVLGSLQSDGTSEALLGYYGRLSPNFTVNAGVGRGVDRGPDWTARTAFIWRFR
jgi:hypothetical protein